MADTATEQGSVLLDADGTLVDSTYLHVDAWMRAFALVGVRVQAWRVHRAIGMGSPQLVASLVGDDEAERLRDQVSDYHEALYLDVAGRVRPLRGARELVVEIARRGARPVLATSAAPAELERLRATLDIDEHLFAITSSKDVTTAKPDPELVHTALERAGTAPERTIMLGDAVWDVIAARRAGIECVAVRTGGIGADELRDAGALAVYEDITALLDDLDDSPLARAWR
ncbi:HAD family hydrolase [Oerskovia sp. USHLN155]|uniref:HAD family hydrolase n=1 Tax=Oerskovia sp. USHLN155 TaxID=3081288 RepID=UPI0030169C42